VARDLDRSPDRTHSVVPRPNGFQPNFLSWSFASGESVVGLPADPPILLSEALNEFMLF
jgi:hypothetical protein